VVYKHLTRRHILKSAAALAATASVGCSIGRAWAQGPQSRQIDAALRRAVEAKESPASSRWRQTTRG